jgi:hypothetical protein
MEKATTELKTKWGAAFDSKVRFAQTASTHFGGPEFKEYLESTGLGNHPRIIEVFAKIGESLKEDTFVPGSLPPKVNTPDQAQEEINKIMGDMNHPYWIETHASHNDAVEKLKKLYAQLG